jgi:hypothetical protein
MPDEAEPTGNAPAASGMLTPQKAEGDFAAARLDAYHAQKMLERAIARVGEKTPEGKAMLAAITKLVEQFGEREEETAEFSDAELKRMLATLMGPGEAPKPPGQAAAAPPPGMQ